MKRFSIFSIENKLLKDLIRSNMNQNSSKKLKNTLITYRAFTILKVNNNFRNLSFSSTSLNYGRFTRKAIIEKILQGSIFDEES